MDCYAVVKKGKDWLVGKISGDSFTSYKQIKKLSEAKSISSCITLKKHLKDINEKPSLEKELQEKLGLSSIYVLDRPLFYEDESEWEKDWWVSYNEKCMKCSKNCKQSSRVDIVRCTERDD